MGLHSAPQTSPRVCSDQNVEANPAVPTRASQDTRTGESGRTGVCMGTSFSSELGDASAMRPDPPT
eukprot:4433905-Pyramimonas_sp.AAC.1